MTRGEKLNNPGNIRRTNQVWVGKVDPSSDAEFEQFDNCEHGIRAMAKILLNYFHSGIDTITGIVNKYAPAADNNPVSAYIENVCSRSGFDADAHLMLTLLDDLFPIVKGMIDQEQGDVIYTDEQIMNGCRMALGQDLLAAEINK